jgi:hypothetical protein
MRGAFRPVKCSSCAPVGLIALSLAGLGKKGAAAARGRICARGEGALASGRVWPQFPPMKMPSRLLVVGLLAFASAQAATPQDEFWQRLQSLCGQAFVGKMVEGTAASDAAFAEQRLVMHVRACGPDEIRVPFHVGENRSRTWVFTRTPTGGVRLKHDHRHEDGSDDRVTLYGGDTATDGTATTQDFPADAWTAELIPAAKHNVWTVGVEPGKRFTYALRREAEGRRFRVEFDLTRPVEPPPAPWGAK